MTKFSNPITKVTDAADHVNLIRDTLGLSNSVPIICKPQDIDKTVIEILEIDTELKTGQMADLLILYPELNGKEV